MKENSSLEESIFGYTKEQECVTGADNKLAKLNNLKGNCPKR